MEFNGQNPCCVGARGTSGWIMFSIRHSVILDGVQSSGIRGCCRVFIWFKYCDDSVLFPDVRD